MTYKELIEECKKRGFTLVDDNGKFSVLDKKGKGSPPFEHITLNTGDELNHPDFPVLFYD